MIGNAETLLKYLFNVDKNKIFEIKEVKEKRTLTANSYYQTLLTQLSMTLNIPREELHERYIKECSPCLLVPLTKNKEPNRYFKYYEYYKESELNGIKADYYKVYLGTSEMNSKEFSILLNEVVEDCKMQGIPTLDDIRINELIKEMKM